MAGLNMMVWGYFMKLCIAENVAPYVDAVFNNIDMHNGKSIWLASFFFAFQIFCDFGGRCGFSGSGTQVWLTIVVALCNPMLDTRFSQRVT